jgi:hypothetical protein
MKGDFTRNTFNPKKHYRDVLMQQGRVQVDADWNEQAELTARRDETTTADIVGDCGGPADDAAFAVSNIPPVGPPSSLPPVSTSKAAAQSILPVILPTATSDFLLSAGRYYVDGIQCENEQPVRFTTQPDRLDVGPLAQGSYLLYLDVWHRHLTALEDGQIREPALGGPDHGTRVKTIWQVRALDLATAANPGVIQGNPCGSGADLFNNLADPGTALLTAGTATQPAPKDPCLIPPGAGYTGLENQLYRVEIHDPSTWKWSRENGSPLTRVERINGNEITVSSLGPDKNLGFVKDAWVEILDDSVELEGKPGQLAQIDDVDEATRIITLKSVASSLVPAGFSTSTYPNGIVPERHPKLRRWEGIVTPIKSGIWLPLESGVQVKFAPNGDYRTGHYWEIPARTATAQSPSGEIEWPVDSAGNRLALSPSGIKHHFCRLGIVSVLPNGSVEATDCRCLWPALTTVPRLFYVSGDGQEVMPDLTDTTGKRYKLPQPLIVGLGNGQCAPPGTKVRFSVIVPSTGRVAVVGTATPTGQIVDVPIGANGMAGCDFHLDGTHYSQQVRAQLLDAAGVPCSLPIIFNASLSKASEVAYDPSGCAALQGKKTVQEAIARLASIVELHAVGGDGQDTEPGAALAKPIRVLVTSSCGPVAQATVTFTVVEGFVAGGSTGTPSFTTKTVLVPTDANGIAECRWRMAAAPNTQQLSAEITQLPTTPPGLAMGAHRSVLFTANLRSGKDCCVTVGEGGDFATLDTAITTLIGRDAKEICICLLPGDHVVPTVSIVGANAALPSTGGATPAALPATAVMSPPAIALSHLHIHGCGRASRILLKSWFVAMNLSSITLQDLCIYADVTDPASVPPPTHVILIHNCGDVTITGCHLRQTVARNDWVIVSAAQRINIADNVIQSSAPITFTPIAVEDTGTVATEATPANARIIAETATASLAGKKKSERAAFIKEFRKIAKEIPSDDPRKKSLAATLKHLSAKSSSKRKSGPAAIEAPMMASIETPQGLAETVAAIGLNLFAMPMPALVIADAMAETAIVNNVITGEVRIYGISGALSEAVFHDLALGIRRQTLIVNSPSTRSLRIEGNTLTKVVTDSHIVQPTPPGQKGTPALVGLFARMSLLDNLFNATGNQWLATHVISNGNYFLVQDSGLTIGTAAGASFICMGTSANWFLVILRYGVPPIANRFTQSANLMTLTPVV